MRRRTSIIFTSAVMAGIFVSLPLRAAPYGAIAPPAGPYAPAAGQAGSTAIPYDSPLFTEWASSVPSLTRGPQDIANPTGPLATFGSISNVLGPANADTSKVLSLGDGGSITVAFDQPIANGPGADFAVFENAFNDNFLELGFVEVSSDGTNFVRFPAVSNTQTTTQEGGFANDLQAANLYDLAGKYRVGYGTPFDLSEVAGTPNVDVNNIRFVRIVDVVGRITPVTDSNSNVTWSPSTDYFHNIVNDPYSTPFASGGFDLNGVGVINQVPEACSSSILLLSPVILYRRSRRVSKVSKSITKSIQGE